MSEKTKPRSPRPPRVVPIKELSRLIGVVVAAEEYLEAVEQVARGDRPEGSLADQRQHVFEALLVALYGPHVFAWITEELS